ncbi:Metallo-dependent phosphatase [Sistotremastrum niveocremeum HHB9708]|uniref:Metallo-dependent phosphatase n=1 Tax=Sistotremastrum niveocremeum HHB9708 TaxID=1314777 RepID=A0A165AKX8_9AGAM|nr:Metallo-dependent phosphatase [Sistotremastrum niveocremeum HHB9708]
MTIDTFRAYTDYDPLHPPEHPGQDWTRFVCISDTHSGRFPVPPGDILLHAGDLSSWGQVHQLQTTTEWLASLPHPHKILVGGNHDLCLDPQCTDESPSGEGWDHRAALELVRGEKAVQAGLIYLDHQSCNVTTRDREWRVYGSPSSPMHLSGAFQYIGSAQAEEVCQKIPTDTEILITHTPAHRVLDLTSKGKHAGCQFLTKRMASLADCKLHVCGHIHEAHGVHVVWQLSST